jgi:hypothetical protein
MENKLDQYFRENLQDREFEFENSWWQQAEALLESERRRKRRKLAAWWTAGVVALALGVAGWYFLSEKTGVKADPTATQIPAAKQDENAVPSDSFEKNEPSQAGNMKDETKQDGKSEQSFFDQKQTKNQLSNQKKPALRVASGVFKKDKTTIAGDKKSENSTMETAASHSPANLTPEKNTDHNPTDSALPKSDFTPKAALRTEDLAALSQLSNPVRGDFLNDLKTGKNVLRGNDRLSIGFTLAQLMQPGASNGEQTILGHRAGLVASYPISKNWFASTGIQYHRRSGTFEVSKAAEIRRYRFGAEVDSQLLKPSSLHYFSVPVLVGWQRGRHVLETGLLLDYLAGVRGAIGTFEKTTDLPPRKEFRAKQTGWLVEDGYKKMTATAQLGYRYRVNRQLSFGASANYTTGGILDKNYEPPVGNFLLKEADQFYLTVQATYFIK